LVLCIWSLGVGFGRFNKVSVSDIRISQIQHTVTSRMV
jgi:hypothetical protein